MWLSADIIEAHGFCVLGPMQTGGQSVVYPALYTATAEQVALKLYAPGAQHKDQMLREVAAMANVDHPHIARMVAAGHIEQCAYVASCWIDGLSLQAHSTAKGPLPLDETCDIVAQLASAIDALSDRQLVHGDLTPRNVVIGTSGHCTLIDFGLSQTISKETIAVDAPITGTMKYLAPERIQGKPPSPLSDQYALAILAYELMSQQWPLADAQVSPSEVSVETALHHHVHGAVTALSEYLPAVGSAVDTVFFKALSKTPTDRYPSASEFATALRNAASTPAPQVSGANTKLTWQASLTTLCIAGTTLGLLGLANGTHHSAEQDNHPERATQHCNLMPNATFDKSVSDNFYQDSANPDVVRIVEHPELEGRALQVGASNAYGLYGQIVPVEADKIYQYSVMVYSEGPIEIAELTVSWLDSQWQPMTEPGKSELVETALRIDTLSGSAALNGIQPPAKAHYAVPSVFKNGSSGQLWVDNLVFAPEDCGK